MSGVFFACCSSMTSLLFITASGAVLGKLKIYNKDSNTALVKSAFQVFFPMFTAFIVAQTICNMQTLIQFWQLQLGTILTSSLGLALGFLLVTFIPPPDSNKYTIVSIVGFANLGNIPILIVESSCSEYGILKGYEECDVMPGFVMVSTIAFNVMVWGISYTLILKDAHAQAKHKVEDFFSAASQDRTSLMSATFDEPVLPPKSDVVTVMQNAFCTTVPLSSILGVFFGLIPGISSVFFDNDAPLRFISNSMINIGFLAIIVTQQVLGYNIQDQLSKPQTVKPKLLVGVLIAKLLIVPLITQVIVYWAYSAGMLTYGIAFVIVLGASCPPGVATMGLNQLLDVGVDTTSIVFMFAYPISVLTLTLNCYLFTLIEGDPMQTQMT